MKIVEIDGSGHTGLAAYAGNTMKISLRLVTPAVGDHVLVHAGCAIQVVQAGLAEEILSVYEELEASANGP